MPIIKQFVVNNPYRMLDLFSNTSYKEQIVQSEKLELAVEFKKDKPSIINAIFNFMDAGLKPRTLALIQQANHQLEQELDRVFYSFFWFAKVDEIDKQAFDYFEQFNYSAALALWQSALEKESKLNWLINLKLTQFLTSKTTELTLFSAITEIIENKFKEYCTLYDFNLPNLAQTQLNLIELFNEKISKQDLEERFELALCLPESSILKQAIESELLQNTQNEAQDLMKESKRLKAENAFWSKPVHFKQLINKTEELQKLHQFAPNNLSLNRTINDYVSAIIAVIGTYPKEDESEINSLIETIKKVKALPQKETNELLTIIDTYQDRDKVAQDDLIRLIEQMQEIATKDQQKLLQTQLNKITQKNENQPKKESLQQEDAPRLNTEDKIVVAVVASVIMALFIAVNI